MASTKEKMGDSHLAELVPRAKKARLAQANPLLDAIEKGQLHTVKQLIESSAAVNAIAANGKSALMLAADASNVAVVELLLLAGARFKDGEDRSAADEDALRVIDAHLRDYRPWKGAPFPFEREGVDFVALPDGRELRDAVVWRGFVQDELGLDPAVLWRDLLAFPTWDSGAHIPDPSAPGSAPHWIRGDHKALSYRGNAIKRHKMWFQGGAPFADGMRKYGYTGWQWKISNATHAVGTAAPVARVAAALNAGLAEAGGSPRAHNHWIVTRYDDEDDNIGFHADKTKDFADNSYFIVLKLGAPRPFAFRMHGDAEPFYSEVLPAGTAVFVRGKAPSGDDANAIVQHGVPSAPEAVGVSGSIVSRDIATIVPWAKVRKEIAKRRPAFASDQHGSNTQLCHKK